MIEVIRNNNVWFVKSLMKYNLYTLFSGISSLIILYILSFYFNRPIYFFFIIPFTILYVLFLNLCYALSYFILAWFIKNKSFERFLSFAIWITFLLNILLLLECLFVFGIITD